METLNEILRSQEYFDYKVFLSQTFFSWSEDFFTLKLYEMGTASQNIDEKYVERNAYNEFKRYTRRLCFEVMPQLIFIT